MQLPERVKTYHMLSSLKPSAKALNLVFENPNHNEKSGDVSENLMKICNMEYKILDQAWADLDFSRETVVDAPMDMAACSHFA
jgi:hypothetical protein